jgi:hypothetical protein
MLGETRTLERERGRPVVEKECDPTEVTGSKTLLPTIIDEGLDDEGG